MKVILLDNVKGIGRVGDIKDVSDGYARNFLVPRGLGKPASDGAVREAQVLSAQKRDAAHLEHAQATTVAERLNGMTVVMHGTANEQGTLFSAIPRAKIAETISGIAGVHIAPDRIRSDDHLKHLGPHLVHIRFADGIVADLTVDIRN